MNFVVGAVEDRQFDNTPVAEGSGYKGEIMLTKYSDLDDDKYSFTVKVTEGDQKGRLANATVWIQNYEKDGLSQDLIRLLHAFGFKPGDSLAALPTLDEIKGVPVVFDVEHEYALTDADNKRIRLRSWHTKDFTYNGETYAGYDGAVDAGLLEGETVKKYALAVNFKKHPDFAGLNKVAPASEAAWASGDGASGSVESPWGE